MSKFAPFPDQKYINHVRDALWGSPSRASVMVGSGFSKFAVPLGPGVGELPLWPDIATELYKGLHPESLGGRPQDASGTASDPYFALRLAQEYKEAFGRSSLHLLLEQLVRDGDFRPGRFHRRLLRLPWRDVFTTNWDELLERTCLSVPERPYSVVHNKDQIPLSKQPRIVKLHGSLRGHYPLISTADDYCAYPQLHAPFVNTVQQAMMETVFCLIGFSGHDPNFLKWSAWVQHNLGDAAPRIYLAGWLELSADARKCLLDRKVAAIDLAGHPQASRWPPHLRHKNAVDWILRTLKYGRKYDVTDWPTIHDKAGPQIPIYLQPLEVVSSDQPIEESWHSAKPADSQSTEDSVRKTLHTWAHNRALYPGWLIAPLEVRQTLIGVTAGWQLPVLEIIDRLPTIDQLAALREFVWRHEITLEPISSELESAALDTLALIDCESQTVDGVPKPELGWSEIRENWREVALTLLTVARYRLDQESFFERTKMLTPFVNDDPDVNHRLKHEKSLWAAFSLDFEELEHRLKEWKTQDCDPMWMLRKAALLSEAGMEEESESLTQQAIADIRRIPADDRSVAGPSREGWALWSTIDYGNRQEVFNRWSHLAPLKCDAYTEKAEVTNSLTTSDRQSDPPDFDHGTRHSTSIGFGARGDFQFRKSYRPIRLSEIAGIPVATPNASPGRANGADLVELAADGLVKFDAELAARLVLRACTYDKDKALMRVLSRCSIALMPDARVRRLVADCKRLIDYSLPRRWIEHIRVAVEVLSRLVSRLDPESALEVFDFSMNLYRDRKHPFASHAWISDPLQNLLNRTWTALSPDEKTRRGLELLAAPIAGLDHFDVQFPDQHPDPGELVSEYPAYSLPNRNSSNDAQWQDALRMILRALRAGGAPRIRAANRLVPMAEQGILTESEASDVASALWDSDHTPIDSLPGGTRLCDWGFLLLPEPEPGIAYSRFLGKWLSSAPVDSRLDSIRSGNTISVTFGARPTDSKRLEDTLWNLGDAISGLTRRGRSLDLPDAERGHLIDLIAQWSTTSFELFTHPPFRDETRRWTRWAIRGMAPILSYIEISEPLGEMLFEKLKGLTDLSIPAHDPVGGLVKQIPQRTTDLENWLRMGLASGDREMATGALSGLASWLEMSSPQQSPIQSPPADVLRELGFIIAARRKESLEGALLVARWVFDKGSSDARATMFESVTQGLSYLAEELRYDRQEVADDVPTLRLRCTELASSMAKAGLQDAPAVARWLEIASKDPFADVRNVVATNSGV